MFTNAVFLSGSILGMQGGWTDRQTDRDRQTDIALSCDEQGNSSVLSNWRQFDSL